MLALTFNGHDKEKSVICELTKCVIYVYMTCAKSLTPKFHGHNNQKKRAIYSMLYSTDTRCDMSRAINVAALLNVDFIMHLLSHTTLVYY